MQATIAVITVWLAAPEHGIMPMVIGADVIPALAVAVAAIGASCCCWWLLLMLPMLLLLLYESSLHFHNHCYIK